MAIENLPIFTAMNEQEVKPPCAPPHKPLTPVESHFAIMEKVNACIAEVNHFEQRVRYEMDKFMDATKTENNGFKEAIQTSYNAFQQLVRNEINNFETNLNASYELFKQGIVHDNTILQESLSKLVDDKVAELTELQKVLSDGYANFKADVNRIIDQYKIDVTALFNQFTQTVENHMTEQDSKIEAYKNYMVDNLLISVETVIDQKVKSGEIAEIMTGIFGSTKTFKGSLTLAEIQAVTGATNGDYYYCSDNGEYYMWADSWVNIGTGAEIAQQFEAFKQYAVENDELSPLFGVAFHTNNDYTSIFNELTTNGATRELIPAEGTIFFTKDIKGLIARGITRLFVTAVSDMPSVSWDHCAHSTGGGTYKQGTFRKIGNVHYGVVDIETVEGYDYIRIKFDNRGLTESASISKIIISDGVYTPKTKIPSPVMAVISDYDHKFYVEIDTTAETITLSHFIAYYNKTRFRNTNYVTLSYNLGENDGATRDRFVILRNGELTVTDYTGYEETDIVICGFNKMPSYLNQGIGFINVNRAFVDGVEVTNKDFKVGYFIGSYSDNLFEFNTTDETVTVEPLYLFYKNRRYDLIERVTLPYNENTHSASKALVYREGALTIVLASEVITLSDIVLFYFNSQPARLRNINNYSHVRTVIVDGVKYPKVTAVNTSGDLTVYVSPSGSDSNDGLSMKTPVLTVNKAVALGAKNICLNFGKYYVPFTISGKDEINIFTYWTTFGTTYADRPKAEFFFAEQLETADDTATGLKVANYDGTLNPYVKAVFIDKTAEIIDGSSTRSTGYNVTLWATFADQTRDKKLLPVLTVEECTATADSWVYSDNKIYINVAETDVQAFYISNDEGCQIANVDKLSISDVKFDYAQREGLTVRHCSNVVFRNCEFNHSGMGNGLYLYNVNGSIYNCVAYKNRNDGFNIHGYGDTHFYDCYGYHNYDDGISHHDGCVGSINGGEYYGNPKGGVASPTHGAKIDIYNVVTHNNGYGIYAHSDKDIVRDIIISGCAIYDNNVGVGLGSCRAKMFNNVIKNNTTEFKHGANGEVIQL